nr:sigma factor-like helix-turn-helix DNA-binding protein [Holdemania massiliensis]
MFWHQDWPEQAAKELGIKGTDNKHPPGQQLCVQKTALEAQLKQLRAARSALGLDAWLDSLSQDDRQIIRLVYEDEMTQQEVAPRVNLTRSGVRNRIDTICKKRTAGR